MLRASSASCPLGARPRPRLTSPPPDTERRDSDSECRASLSCAGSFTRLPTPTPTPVAHAHLGTPTHVPRWAVGRLPLSRSRLTGFSCTVHRAPSTGTTPSKTPLRCADSCWGPRRTGHARRRSNAPRLGVARRRGANATMRGSGTVVGVVLDHEERVAAGSSRGSWRGNQWEPTGTDRVERSAVSGASHDAPERSLVHSRRSRAKASRGCADRARRATAGAALGA